MNPQGLDRLEGKIDRLKREYELFLAGRRRGEPLSLRDEVQREVLALTRHPWSSTAARFRVRSLAHRFQAVESQARHLLESRAGRKRVRPPAEASGEAPVLFERACLAERDVFLESVIQLHRRLVRVAGEARSPALDTLVERIEVEVRRQLQEPGVLGIRFRVEEGERGPKVRGEVVRMADPTT